MQMRSRPLGQSDLVVSELGFGAFGVGGNVSGNSYGPVDDRTSIAAIHAAIDRGCTFIDTADVYGYGHSEEIIAKALREYGSADSVVVATKGGANFDSGSTIIDFSSRHLVRAVESSLRRLGRDAIDLYQLHNPSVEVLDAGDAISTMDELVQRGHIRYYGVAVHTLSEGLASLRHLHVTAVQLPLNMFSLLDEASTMLKLTASAAKAGVGVIAREPLAAGFLSGAHQPDQVYGAGEPACAMAVVAAESIRRNG